MTVGTLTDYHAAFDAAKVGAIGALIDGVTVNITTGRYWHVNLIATDTTGGGAFATALTTVLTGLGSTVTVAYDAVNVKYTLSKGSAFTIGSQTTAWQTILGTPPSGSASSHVSVNRPYYVQRPLIAGQSSVSGVYEPDGLVRGATSDNGTPYSISPLTMPQLFDWTQMYERETPLSGGGAAITGGSGGAVFTTGVTATMPWAWQDFWKHVRGQEFFAVTDQTAPPTASVGSVYKMRPDAAAWKPMRAIPDYTIWSLPFRAYLIGSQ